MSSDFTTGLLDDVDLPGEAKQRLQTELRIHSICMHFLQITLPDRLNKTKVKDQSKMLFEVESALRKAMGR